mmetsp:Transcript_9393/g.39449  ORF Transcript_9393/g.39449 Transcript_9393/m.39449 type:complete len:236 (+) Transcript_9393:487-1194(+)
MFTRFTSSSHARNSGSFSFLSVSRMTPRAPKATPVFFSSGARRRFSRLRDAFRSSSSSDEDASFRRRFLCFLCFLCFLLFFRRRLREDEEEEEEELSESELPDSALREGLSSRRDFLEASLFLFFSSRFASAAASFFAFSSTSRNAFRCLYASSAFHPVASSAARHVGAEAFGTKRRRAPSPASCIAWRCASAWISIMLRVPRASGSPSLCREYSMMPAATTKARPRDPDRAHRK